MYWAQPVPLGKIHCEVRDVERWARTTPQNPNPKQKQRWVWPPPRRSSSPSYETALRERDLWPARCDDLLDLVLCEYCEEEKHQVYRHGTPEVVLCWKPCHCSWPCNRVRSIFKD